MYTVYSMPKTRGTRVAWTLEELGIDYRYITHTPRDPEVKQLNPVRKLPILDHDGFVLTESAAICTYLADQHPESGLSPEPRTQKRAEFDAWNFYLMTDLEAPLWTHSKNSYLYPEKIRVPEVLSACENEFERSVNALHAKLGNREYLLGDCFTVSDILCGHCLIWARNINFKIKAQNVNEYVDRISARRALKRACIREKRETEKQL